MGKRRRNFSSSFKAKVALEAIKGMKTLNQLAGEYSVHPNAIGKWKKELLENASDIFDKQRGKKTRLAEENRDYLSLLSRYKSNKNNWLGSTVFLFL